MCILAYVTHHSPRFPLILVSNRDELLSRGTRRVGIESRTSLLWSVDETAGGSWLGVHAVTGRFAILTNCLRAPTAPLRARAVPGFRGAMPFAEAVRRTSVHSSPAPGATGGTNLTLNFKPDRSRGLIVRDFLLEGKLPGDDDDDGAGAGDPAGEGAPPSLRPPYYAGYNLITAESLFDTREMQMRYTTNRNAAQHADPIAHGVVHCLSNSYMDNWAEPKSRLLRSLFEESLKVNIPTETEPYDAEAVATSLANHCLCARPEFDIRRELESTDLPEETRQQYKELLEYGVPHLGYRDEAELTELYGQGIRPPLCFTRDSFIERANFLQRNIFVSSEAYGTCAQTIVVVERNASNGKNTVHFSQRECGRDGAAHKAWSHFTLPCS